MRAPKFESGRSLISVCVGRLVRASFSIVLETVQRNGECLALSLLDRNLDFGVRPRTCIRPRVSSVEFPTWTDVLVSGES